MNNGQPPYGDTSAWGQQNAQAGPGQVPVQNPYIQQGYGQQPYAAPYDQGAAYGPAGGQTPMMGQQPMQGAAPQMYQPQQHPQQQAYVQQNWQPYQQPVQQGYQQPYGQAQYPQGYQQPYQQAPYGQQAWPQGAPAAPQYDAKGQPANPYQGFGQGYTGIRTSPASKAFHVPFDVVAKVVLFGVLPVLFVLAMLMGSVALKWVFLAAAVVGITMMWMRDVVSPNMRLILSLICGAMSVVALVGALNGPVEDRRNPGNVQGSSAQGQQAESAGTQASTSVPTAEPTFTPDPYGVDDPVYERVESFFHYWSTNNITDMLAFCSPKWRAEQTDATEALWKLCANRQPQDGYVVQKITGTPDDVIRTAHVKATIDKRIPNASMDIFSFAIMMVKEDGVWYVQPTSLRTYEQDVASATPATENVMPTQPPLYTGTPSTVLYYNQNGGSRYHLDGDCTEVHSKFKPMSTFYFSQLGEEPYSQLDPCNVCGAPIPDD